MTGMFEPEGFIFDFDGTLADSMWVWQHVDSDFMKQHGIEISPEQNELIASLGFEGTAAYLSETFGVEETAEELIEIWLDMALDMYANDVMLKPGVKEFLAAARESGKPMGIATSLQRKLLVPSLNNNRITGMFDEIVICDEICSTGKTTPYPYQVCADRLGVSLGSCAVFEDVAKGAASAKKGGAYVVGVFDGGNQQSPERLQAVCDRYIRSFSELTLPFL